MSKDLTNKDVYEFLEQEIALHPELDEMFSGDLREQSNVNTEFSVGGHWGMKSDVDLFHGKIGIELKVAEQLKSASNVERLIGQVVYYMKK